MTKIEFDNWTKHTERSKRGWMRDEIALRNRGVFFLYHGGDSGTYVEVDDATVTVGTYTDAVPHIGEAFFTVTGRKVFQNQDDAWNAVMSATGVRGLLAMLCGGAS